MNFIRPEARTTLWRWREVLVALIILGLGAWWSFGSFGILQWVGYGFLGIGTALLAAGGQRLRFRTGQGGPGMVSVDEGQITYFGPLTGGSIALGEMTRLALDSSGKPRHWVLSQPGQPNLHIPLNAKGAEVLFDAFSTLPGMRTENLLAKMNSDADTAVLIWQR